MTQQPSLRTDHLVYAVPDLAQAMDQIEQEWGVRPTVGGKHPSGTHNALLALGSHTYLEIIAPDPEQPHAQGRSFGLDRPPSSPRLVTWAVATADLDATLAAVRAAGYDPGEVMAGSRRRPDGVQLAWRSTRIAQWPPPGDGVVPFIIEWAAETPHPASDSAPGCRLRSLGAEHPQAAAVQRMLDALGLDISVTPGAAPALIATIDTPKGEIVLR
jgi:hypothetical protein